MGIDIASPAVSPRVVAAILMTQKPKVVSGTLLSARGDSAERELVIDLVIRGATERLLGHKAALKGERCRRGSQHGKRIAATSHRAGGMVRA